LRLVNDLSLNAVSNSVWTLEPSGTVGLLLRFTAASNHVRDSKHNIVAVKAKWSADIGRLCASSETEACRDADGFRFASAILPAFKKVRAAMDLPMRTAVQLLLMLGNSLSNTESRGVLYGQLLCFVRRGFPSCQMAVLHKARKGLYIFFSCPNSHLACVHYAVAQSAAADEEKDSSKREFEAGDFSGLETESESEGEKEQRKQVGKGVSAAALKKQRFVSAQSMLPRDMVPPSRAQDECLRLIDSARDPTVKIEYAAPKVCPLCLI